MQVQCIHSPCKGRVGTTRTFSSQGTEAVEFGGTAVSYLNRQESLLLYFELSPQVRLRATRCGH